MVNLAYVADLTVWGRRVELAEAAGGIDLLDEDPDELWPPFQTLRYWSEDLRARLDMDYDDPHWRPTLASEAGFLANPDVLEWVWSHEPHWDDFAADVERARSRLEAMLRAGVRPVARGVPCMYDECKGKRLVRKTVPARDKKGNKVWRLTDWHCPSCHREWSEEDYTRHVYAAIERDHWQQIQGEQWSTEDRAARRVGRPEATVRSWVSRGQVAVICTTDERRRTLVLVADVVERDRLARERHARWQAARRAKQMTPA